MCDLPQDGPFRRTPPVRPFELNMRLPSGWINNAIAILPTWPNGWAERQAEGQRAHAGYERNLDEPCEACDSDGSDDSDMDDENDEESEYEIVDYDEVQSPAVATYPNSMPFGHAARMGAGGRRDPQYITSRRGSTHSRSTCSATSARKARIDMPRILVSNNDKTVKMFSLRPIVDALRTGSEWEPPATATATSTSSASAAMPALSAMRHTQANLPPSFTPAGIAQWGLSNLTSSEGLITEAASFPTLTGPHRQGRNISANATGRPIDIDEMISARRRPGSVPSGSGSGSASGPASRPASAAPEQLTLRGSRYLGESASEYRARNPAGDGEETARIRRNMELRQERAAERQRHAGLLHEGSEPRKLSLVGGTRFKVPVNHGEWRP